MFLPIPGMKLLVLAGIPILAALVVVDTDSTSKFISTTVNGKKIFKKEGENLNLTWESDLSSTYGNNVYCFLFGVWVPQPGYKNEKRVLIKVIYGKVNREAKYGYKGHCNNGICQSSVAIYNLMKSDMKSYWIYIEMDIPSRPLEDWFQLRPYVKAKITHFSTNSRNATVKQGAAVNIICRAATGQPEPNVTLYKGNEMSMTIKGKGELMYEIKAATMQDAGEYVCVASNDDNEKSDKRTITLSVEERPKTQQAPSSGHLAKTQAPSSGSNKCFSDPWILGFLLFYRWF